MLIRRHGLGYVILDVLSDKNISENSSCNEYTVGMGSRIVTLTAVANLLVIVATGFNLPDFAEFKPIHILLKLCNAFCRILNIISKEHQDYQMILNSLSSCSRSVVSLLRLFPTLLPDFLNDSLIAQLLICDDDAVLLFVFQMFQDLFVENEIGPLFSFAPLAAVMAVRIGEELQYMLTERESPLLVAAAARVLHVLLQQHPHIPCHFLQEEIVRAFQKWRTRDFFPVLEQIVTYFFMDSARNILDEVEAAMVIQAAWRGHVVRKRMKRLVRYSRTLCTWN